MKKLTAVFGIISVSAFSQNYIQVNNLNNMISNTNYVQRANIQSVQTFASNVQVKRNTVRAVTKINTVKSNPLANNKPAVRRRRNPVIQNNVINQIQAQQPLPRINTLNNPQFSPINQMAYVNNVDETNIGNSFGSESIQIQQAITVQEKQTGHAGDFLEGISLNLPKMNLKTISVSKRSSSSSAASYKLAHLKNKFIKVNRKMKGKLSFKKRLRIKVDNCFKW